MISSWITHIPSSLPWVSCDLLIPGVRILDWKPGPAEHLHLLRVCRTQEPTRVELETSWDHLSHGAMRPPHLKLDTVDQGDPFHLQHPCQPLPLSPLSPAHDPCPRSPSLPLIMTSPRTSLNPTLPPRESLPLPFIHPLDLLSSLP